MKRHFGTTFAIAAAVIALAGCAVDPVVDHTSGGAMATEPFADGLGPSGNSSMVVQVARSTAKRGDLPTAVSLYRRALSIDSSNFEAAAGLAETLSSLGAHDEAADAWRIALKLNPNSTMALRGMGNTLVASGRPALAVEHYERACAIRHEPRLYNGLGVAHDMLEDYKAAQAYYTVGLKDDAENLTLRNNLGLSYLLSGKIPEAVAELKRTAENPRATTQHRMNLALALVMAGDSDSALSVVRTDLGPRGAREQVAYFETVRALGDAPTARQALQAYIRGTPDQKRQGKVLHPTAGVFEPR